LGALSVALGLEELDDLNSSDNGLNLAVANGNDTSTVQSNDNGIVRMEDVFSEVNTNTLPLNGQSPLAKLVPPPLVVPSQNSNMGLNSAPAYNNFYFSYPNQFQGAINESNTSSCGLAATPYGSHSAGPYPTQQPMSFFDTQSTTTGDLFRF
jgi:hypothetical protein